MAVKGQEMCVGQEVGRVFHRWPPKLSNYPPEFMFNLLIKVSRFGQQDRQNRSMLTAIHISILFSLYAPD